MGLSGLNSLTLSPALCATFLRPRSTTTNFLFRAFNRGFQKTADAYARSIEVCARVWYLMLLAFLGLCLLAAYLFLAVPKGFVPEEDQGYFMAIVQLPDAATIERTEPIMARVNDIALDTPGVRATLAIAGYNVVDSIQQPNAGIAWIVLEPWGERTTPETRLAAIMAAVQSRYRSRAPPQFPVAVSCSSHEPSCARAPVAPRPSSAAATIAVRASAGGSIGAAAARTPAPSNPCGRRRQRSSTSCRGEGAAAASVPPSQASLTLENHLLAWMQRGRRTPVSLLNDASILTSTWSRSPPRNAAQLPPMTQLPSAAPPAASATVVKPPPPIMSATSAPRTIPAAMP